MRMHAIFSVPALFILIACSSTNNTNTSTDNDAGSPIDSGGGGVDSGEPTDAGIVSAKLSFKPSNIDLSGIDVSKVKDETSSGTCEIRTDISSCFDKAVFATVTQSDQSKITVIIVKSWKVEPTAHVTLNTLSGNTPIAIVSLGDMDVQGTIDAHGKDVHPAPGGYESIIEQNGSGPGGGPKGDNTFGGAGASYCGVGGIGSVIVGGSSTPAAAKAAYGAPELVPLHGGSSGGGGNTGQGGAGGAGLQLVANGKLTTSPGSYINVGGGGGGFGVTAGGGGSGGSLLIEASTVTIAGIIAANGGGGGGAG